MTRILGSTFNQFNFILFQFINKNLLVPATESISSINIMDGAFSLAFLNNSLTLLAPTPTNISSNSEPDL